MRPVLAPRNFPMKIKSPYLAGSNERVHLSRIPTDDTGKYRDKDQAAAVLAEHQKKLEKLHELLEADSSHALLVVLQSMDAGGKDGAIRHIFSGVNPKGCRVTSFEPPTTIEQEHDFLWRVHQAVPPRGTIGIFNRSHYEDVLVPRVRKQISGKVAKARIEQIADFEKMLAGNSVIILKFFLHISREEQARRFEARLADPEKRWKVKESDFADRHSWPQYQQAYEEAISGTSYPHAPWFIIPADHKWYRNVAISKIVIDAMQALKMRYPKPTFDADKIKL